MTAMDKIRRLVERDYAGVKGHVLAEIFDVTRPVAYRFLNGTSGSRRIAEQLAEQHGGEYQDLFDQYRAEIGRLRSGLRIKAHANRPKRRRYPAPCKVVSMAQPATETHHLTDPSLLPERLYAFVGYAA